MKNRTTYIAILISALVGLTVGIFIGDGNGTPENSHNHEMTINNSGEKTWTCSMHPQIKQPEQGDCPICGMDLIPLDEMSVTDSDIGFQMTESAVKLAGIQTTEIVSNTSGLGRELILSGKIAANETSVSNLVAHFPGRIEKLSITFTGENVRKGQKIAEVYSPELITAQRELLEAKKLAKISPELFSSAKQKLKYWKLSEANIEEIIASEVILEKFPIYATYGGVVTEKKVSVGDYLGAGEVLFEVLNLSTVWAEFDAYESDLSSLSIGNKIKFKVNSISDKDFNGTIEFIDPIINPKTRVAKIRASVNNSSNRLKPEMFIEGVVQASQSTNDQIYIPKTAVLWTGERSVVYLKVPEVELPSFEYKEVLLGESNGNMYEVKEGLTEGDLVVTNGAFVIDAAAQLNNRTSMMNKLVSPPSENAPEILPDYSDETSSEFKDQLAVLTNSYLKVKDDLVNTDPSTASLSIEKFGLALKNTDMSLVKGESHIYWMELSDALETHTGLFNETSEVEEQRRQFSFISKIIIKILKVYGINSDQLYVQYCPMAFNNAGAEWLSHENFIQNPYFGDKMMKCGSIQDSIKTRK